MIIYRPIPNIALAFFGAVQDAPREETPATNPPINPEKVQEKFKALEDGCSHMEAQGLIDFINHSPSSHHAVQEVARELEGGGFQSLKEEDNWPKKTGRYYVIRNGSLIAWALEQDYAIETAFRIVGAHTDSPGFRIKPDPDTGKAGFQQIGVEVYGAPLLDSWLDRDLGIAGRVTIAGDDHHNLETRLVSTDRAVLKMPRLAIHLDRDNKIELNKQTHLLPIGALGEKKEGVFVEYLGKTLGVEKKAILGWDLALYDTQPAQLIGFNDDFISAPRLDNLSSCYCAYRGLLSRLARADRPRFIPMICLYNHEEVASQSNSGARSPFLMDTLNRIFVQRNVTEENRHRALSRSYVVSADATHAGHPNYLDRSEPDHLPAFNKGPVIKINASQSYATSGDTAGWLLQVWEKAGISHNKYFINRNDLPCGTTIGPLTAISTGIPTVDVGLAQLSMHSARETSGAGDVILFVRALEAAFE